MTLSKTTFKNCSSSLYESDKNLYKKINDENVRESVISDSELMHEIMLMPFLPNLKK